jgi:hypothetical protein
MYLADEVAINLTSFCPHTLIMTRNNNFYRNPAIRIDIVLVHADAIKLNGHLQILEKTG